MLEKALTRKGFSEESKVKTMESQTGKVCHPPAHSTATSPAACGHSCSRRAVIECPVYFQ